MDRWPDVEATVRLRASVKELTAAVIAAGGKAERSARWLVLLTCVIAVLTLAIGGLTVALLVKH